MVAPISLYLIASVLAIEENPQPNPSESNDIAFALRQAAKAQKEAKKWLDQNKDGFMRGMDKNAIGQDGGRQGSRSQGSCPGRLFANQGDKGGACFSKGAPPEGVPPNSVSSLDPSFPGKSKTLAPMETKNLLIFVSFSMPEASLKSLFQEAQKQGAILVMRGLYQDSFVQTARKLQQLGISVDIHPELFEAHHITSVPTFIKIDNGHPLYSLKGNVTLDFALKKFDQLIGDRRVGNPLVGSQLVGNRRVGSQPVNDRRIKEGS